MAIFFGNKRKFDELTITHTAKFGFNTNYH